MPDGVNVRVDLPDFRRQLAALGTKMERRVLGRAARAAGNVFKVVARRLAPRLESPDRRRIPGLLASKIVVARSRFGRRGVVAFFVGVRAARKAQRGTARDPFYWRFLEGGWIPRGRGRKLKGGENSRALQRRRLAAGGARRLRVPFLAPAFEQAGANALAKFNASVDEAVRDIDRGAA